MAPGAKKITFHVTHLSQKHIFNCEQYEAAEEIESHFHINIRDVTLYAIKNGKKEQITPDAIADLMHIEIISNRNGQR